MVAGDDLERNFSHYSQGLARSMVHGSLCDADIVSRRHRQIIKDGLKNVHRTTQAERILALLIESGLVYLVSSVCKPSLKPVIKSH